jgi:hypothetical protein
MIISLMIFAYSVCCEEHSRFPNRKYVSNIQNMTDFESMGQIYGLAFLWGICIGQPSQAASWDSN